MISSCLRTLAAFISKHPLLPRQLPWAVDRWPPTADFTGTANFNHSYQELGETYRVVISCRSWYLTWMKKISGQQGLSEGNDMNATQETMIDGGLPEVMAGLNIAEAVRKFGIPAPVFKTILGKFAEDRKSVV